MKKHEIYANKLSELYKQICDTIIALLKERKVESINLYAYWSERNCMRYTFHDVDSDGYGVALYIDKLIFDEKLGDLIELEMLDTNDSSYSTWDLSFLSPSEANYLLEMLEDIFEEADEKDNGRVLKADEEFDDWED